MRISPFWLLATGFWLLPTPALADPAPFTQALQPREFSFPRDHGRHDGFKTEWWYFTGNVREAGTARHFGYQLTFFRSSIAPAPTTRPSGWAMNDLYFAHAAISDVEGKQFLYADRLSRGRAGLASSSDQMLDVALKDWSVKLDPSGAMRLIATDAKFAIDLTAQPGRGPILQGPGGLNAKGTAPGQASYYYSMTRMPTTGTLTVAGRAFKVDGLSWMDHEFSSNALADNQSGWDWLALTLANGTDVMLYRLRDKQGKTDYLSGTRIDFGGAVQYLAAADIKLTPSEDWKSPASKASYPQVWNLTVKGLPAMTIQTRLQNQELQTPNSTDVTYYEGTVDVQDDQGRPLGDGYLEMTGYAKPLPK